MIGYTDCAHRDEDIATSDENWNLLTEDRTGDNWVRCEVRFVEQEKDTKKKGQNQRDDNGGRRDLFPTQYDIQ